MTLNARFHRGRAADSLIDSREIVMHEMERNRVLVVRKFLAVCVGQPGESAHTHPHR